MYFNLCCWVQLCNDWLTVKVLAGDIFADNRRFCFWFLVSTCFENHVPCFNLFWKSCSLFSLAGSLFQLVLKVMFLVSTCFESHVPCFNVFLLVWNLFWLVWNLFLLVLKLMFLVLTQSPNKNNKQKTWIFPQGERLRRTYLPIIKGLGFASLLVPCFNLFWKSRSLFQLFLNHVLCFYLFGACFESHVPCFYVVLFVCSLFSRKPEKQEQKAKSLLSARWLLNRPCPPTHGRR